MTELSVSLHRYTHHTSETPHTSHPGRVQMAAPVFIQVRSQSTLHSPLPPASNIQICIPTCLYISPRGGARRVMARYVIIYCPPRLGDRYLDIFRHTLTSGRHFLGAATCYKYKYQACQLWNDLLATTLHCVTNETIYYRLVSDV